MAAPALKKEGVDGRVNHPIKSGDGHDGAGGWVIGQAIWYKPPAAAFGEIAPACARDRKDGGRPPAFAGVFRAASVTAQYCVITDW
jgi:hypothetical protein